MRVGKIVPTREGDRLYADPTAGRLPALWASDVRPDGSFVFQGGTRTASAAWYEPADLAAVRYASFGRSVLVQRTSSRDQQRRLNAAVVSEALADAHAVYGYVAENHVIVLEPIANKVAVSPDLLAALVNTAIINQRFSAVSGSFSVSARLLARLARPAADALPATAEALDGKLGPLLAALNGILVPKTSKAGAAEIEEPAEPPLSA